MAGGGAGALVEIDQVVHGGVGAEAASGWCGEAVDAAIAAGAPRALRTALQRSALLHARLNQAAVAYHLTTPPRGARAPPAGPTRTGCP